MAHHVQERLVAAELEIIMSRVCAEGLVRLAVRVAPEMHELRISRCDAKRIALAEFFVVVIKYSNCHVGGLVYCEPIDCNGELAFVEADCFG